VPQPTTTHRTAVFDDPSIPGTQELPVDRPEVPASGSMTAVGAAPQHGAPAVAAPAAPTDEVLPTGPVDFVPGLPGLGTPPPPGADDSPAAPAGVRRTPRTPRSPRERAAVIGTVLTVLGLALLESGLLAGFGGRPLWSAVTLWSAFATLATLLVFLPSVGRLVPGARLRPDAAWRVAAGGLTGVAVFWVLVVLPGVDSDRGFVLTAALAALGAALWVAPARRD
jgi:hypothetical protein